MSFSGYEGGNEKPWDPWRHGVPHALLIGLATAVGTKLGEWAIEMLGRKAEAA